MRFGRTHAVVLFLLAVVAGRGEAAAAIVAIGCPGVSVRSLDRSIAFFANVLDFTLAGTQDASSDLRHAPGAGPGSTAHTAHLQLGDECLDLTEFRRPRGRSTPVDSRANDHWFEHIAIVVTDMDLAYKRLRDADVRMVSNVPQTLPASNRDAAGIAALYFRDPDGHYLELIHFPPGKGQAKWQSPSPNLFRGIDHTAIAVADTERSLALYRDKLHLQVVGTSDNFGREQEHLSGVFNAHVRITSLRAANGIGVELLEYLTPTDGRPIPFDAKLSDIAGWWIEVTTTDVADASAEPDRAPQGLPPRLAPTQEPRTTWVRDPDGHILRLRRYD